MTIDLPGSQIEVEYTDAMELQIRDRYGLTDDDMITPEIVRNFFVTELITAIEKGDKDA